MSRKKTNGKRAVPASKHSLPGDPGPTFFMQVDNSSVEIGAPPLFCRWWYMNAAYFKVIKIKFEIRLWA